LLAKPCSMYQNCRRTACHKQHKSIDPNQQSLCLPLILALLAETKNIQTWAFAERTAAIFTCSPYKNKLQEDQRLEIRGNLPLKYGAEEQTVQS
jgi:hypothetical protein